MAVLTNLRMQIEVYADPAARGGVLEPEGIVEIKFRKPDLTALMHRLDPVIRNIARSNKPGTAAAIKKREAELLPVYRQASRSCMYCSSGFHLERLQHLAIGLQLGPMQWTSSASVTKY